MEALHARYPFLDAAREAVESADVDLASAITDEGPIVARAYDRVRGAIEDGDIGEPHRSTRVELLSYPVARVLVSLVDEPGLVECYARAEATTAFERFRAASEGAELRSVASNDLDMDDLLRELDLARRVERGDSSDPDGRDVRVDVTAFLDLTGELGEEEWRLSRRALADGWVVVSHRELEALLQEAIRSRVADGLPLSVPDPIADALTGEVEEIQSLLADVDRSWNIDAVEPDRFPPCVSALLERVRAGDSLPRHSRFSLVTFLATAGMETDAIVDTVVEGSSVSADELIEQVTHLREDEGASIYPPPSCATMQAYGDCVNMDALCETIAHPMSYYERRLRGDDPVDYAERLDNQ